MLGDSLKHVVDAVADVLGLDDADPRVDWMATTPDFPLEDFASEVRECTAALRRWDVDRDGVVTYTVHCPADDDRGTCGCRLRLSGEDVDGRVVCPRCRSDWPVAWLIRVAAESADSGVWMDAEAILTRFGVDKRTLARWVREERLERRGNQYDARPLLARHADAG